MKSKQFEKVKRRTIRNGKLGCRRKKRSWKKKQSRVKLKWEEKL